MIVLKAIAQDGTSLKYASEELRKDREFVLKVIETDRWALQFASEELLKDRDVVLKAVEKDNEKDNRWVLQYAVARAVESWLGLLPVEKGRRRLGALNLEELRGLCGRARIPYDARPHHQEGDTKEALRDKICAALEEMPWEMQDTGLKRDRSSGASSNSEDPKRQNGEIGED